MQRANDQDLTRGIRRGGVLTAMAMGVAGMVMFSACSRGDAVTSGTTEPTVASTDVATDVPAEVTVAPMPSTVAETTEVTAIVPPTMPDTVPVSTAPVPATTVAPEPVPTTTAPPVVATTTTTTAPPLVGTPMGAAGTLWVAGSEEGDPEAMSDGVNCLGLYEALGAGTLSYSRCGPWAAFGGDYVWTVVKGASNRFFAVVWQETAPFTWVPKMRLLEPIAGEWDSVIIVAADIDAGPNQELVSGIRFAGSGGHLDLDVMDIRGGNPAVVAHGNYESATAYTEAGTGVYVWTPNFAPADPLCCPSSWSQYLIASEGGTWTIAPGVAGAPIEAIPVISEF